MLTKFRLFEAYNPNENVQLKKGKKIILVIKRYEISKLNTLIINLLNTYYGKYGYRYHSINKTINVNGKFLETELLDKFVNNIRLFSNIAIKNKLNTPQEFISHVIQNMKDIYLPTGSEFEKSYEIIIKTSGKGKRGEEASKRNFERLLFNKTKMKINIESPDSIEEDNKSIDGKFIYNNKLVLIQIKPFTEYEFKNNKILVYTSGSLSFNTHYLLLYKEYFIGYDEDGEPIYDYDFISLNNGITKDKIYANNGIYETDRKNIIDMSGMRITTQNYNL